MRFSIILAYTVTALALTAADASAAGKKGCSGSGSGSVGGGSGEFRRPLGSSVTPPGNAYASYVMPGYYPDYVYPVQYSPAYYPGYGYGLDYGQPLPLPKKGGIDYTPLSEGIAPPVDGLTQAVPR